MILVILLVAALLVSVLVGLLAGLSVPELAGQTLAMWMAVLAFHGLVGLLLV